MKTTVDKFGRMVIPKPMREELGIGPGTKVELSQQEGKVVVEPIQDQPNWVEKDGILVFTGELLEDIDIVELIDRERQKRIEQFFPKSLRKKKK